MSDHTLHLTEPNPTLGEFVRRTPHGMAHWAGSGPQGKHCRECTFWDHGRRYYASGGKHRGVIKPARCTRYTEMMRGELGGELPHDTPACKYFDAAEKVPPIKESRT